MKHIALLGTGSHSRNEHIPALEHLLHTRDDFRVQAVCDLNEALASEVAATLQASNVFTDLNDLLHAPDLDGIIAVTPTPLTCELTMRILEAGIPVLMEKPLGATLEEADKVVSISESTGTPVMVGMNRRHDPVMRQVADWLEEKHVTYARAIIQRQNRREDDFIEDAALHPVDLLCSILGSGELDRVISLGPDCGKSVLAHLTLGRTPALLEILPACGAWGERYYFSGNGFSIEARPQKHATLSETKRKLTCTAPEGESGRWTTGETVAFLDALNGTAPWTPTPSDVRTSMQLTLEIAESLQPDSKG